LNRRSSAIRSRIRAAGADAGRGPVPGAALARGTGFIPPIIDLSVLDRKDFVDGNTDAIVFTRKACSTRKGLFGGGLIGRD